MPILYSVYLLNFHIALWSDCQFSHFTDKKKHFKETSGLQKFTMYHLVLAESVLQAQLQCATSLFSVAIHLFLMAVNAEQAGNGNTEMNFQVKENHRS